MWHICTQLSCLAALVLNDDAAPKGRHYLAESIAAAADAQRVTMMSAMSPLLADTT